MSTQAPMPQYHALREQIEGIMSEGKLHTRQAGEWGKVETYWHIGDALQTHFRGHPRAEYGQQVVRNLSKDIGLGPVVLWEILHFRRALPILSTYKELGWSHMREVLRAPSQDQRLFYLKAAEGGAWTVRQLREAIRADAYGQHTDQPFAVSPDEDPCQGRPLRAGFGDLYTYSVVPGGNPASPELELDLGFHVTSTLGTLGRQDLHDLQPGALVTSTRTPDGSHTFTRRPPRTRRYTYLAWVHRVVDGDTLIAVVDLGLGLRTGPRRLRLRGIDCPELTTLAGRTARTFVQKALAPVEFIVLTTHRTDAYGRYLVDVRYLPGESDPEVVRRRGAYLNRQLLDERLARRYQR